MTDQLKIISKKEFLEKYGRLPNQEEVWDEISDLWNEYKKKPFFTVEDFLKKASSIASSDLKESENSKNAKNAKDIKIIDLGCGSGRNMIASDNIEYYGVDISENQLKAAEKLAKEKGINAKFFKSKGNKLPKDFKNEMFDYGLFIATLHCIEGEKERENALHEFYRVLKKDAEGLISVWNSEDSRFKSVKENKCGDIYMSWKKDGKEYYRYYYLYNEKELIDLLKRVGFNILEVKTNLDNLDSKIIAKSSKDRFSKKNIIIRLKK